MSEKVVNQDFIVIVKQDGSQLVYSEVPTHYDSQFVVSLQEAVLDDNRKFLDVQRAVVSRFYGHMDEEYKYASSHNYMDTFVSSAKLPQEISKDDYDARIRKLCTPYAKDKEKQKTKKIVEKSVGDIEISCKIFALCGELFPSTEEQPDFTYKTINNLRLVRNEGFHRCQVEGRPANEKLEKFYKYNDFNTVRETLRKYTTTIKEQLELPWNKPEEYQVWTFTDFAKEKGQPKRVSVQCEKGSLPSVYLSFPSPNGNMENTRVDFGSELGILTAKEIVDKKDELFVVQFINANIYYLHDSKHINNYTKPSNSI